VTLAAEVQVRAVPRMSIFQSVREQLRIISVLHLQLTWAPDALRCRCWALNLYRCKQRPCVELAGRRELQHQVAADGHNRHDQIDHELRSGKRLRTQRALDAQHHVAVHMDAHPPGPGIPFTLRGGPHRVLGVPIPCHGLKIDN
jgi:hypothetical protein